MTFDYQEIFRLAKPLYQNGCPLLVEDGAIIKHTLTGDASIWLKIRNLGRITVKSCNISIRTYDSIGRETGMPIILPYTEVMAAHGKAFGSEALISLGNRWAVSFALAVIEIFFIDRSTLKMSSEIWETAPNGEPINGWSSELEQQFQIDGGKTLCKYVPMRTNDGLFICTCGKVNLSSGKYCYFCGRNMDELLLKSNTGFLREQIEKRKQVLHRERSVAKAKTDRIKEIIVLPLAVICLLGVVFIPIEIIPAIKYNQAETLVDDGKYEEAKVAFTELGGYKDSKIKIYEIERMVTERDYQSALKFLDDGNYDDAISAFVELDGYLDSEKQIKEAYYRKAEQLNRNGSFGEAYDLYLQLMGYRDVDSILENDPNIVFAARSAAYAVGNIIMLGKYEQDNDEFNGKEEIEWLVLARDGDKALLISRYCLDCQPYHTKRKNVTWETCTLSAWLNDDFFSNAFSIEEQKAIQTTLITADRSPNLEMDQGDGIEEKVFLLSIEEAGQFFDIDSERQAEYTLFVKGKGAYVSKDRSLWWLRSAGFNNKYAAYVDYLGRINVDGNFVDLAFNAVRPAIWVDISELKG